MIEPINEMNRKSVLNFFKENWNTTTMVISSGVYHIKDLDGFLFLEDNQLVGLITYAITSNEIEIISLDSKIEGKGIGTSLFQTLEDIAINLGKPIILYTTNDNLKALKFWQKRGFRMVHIVQNAVDEARKIKEEIPIIGYDGIPLHDEILFQKSFPYYKSTQK